MFALARSTLPNPPFELEALKPGIVHIGLGGFHRAHMARYTHDLMALDKSALEWGIIGAGLRDSDGALLDTLRDQECLYTLVERSAGGEERTIIGSIIDAIEAWRSTESLLRHIDEPGIRIVSATVTEHGYCIDRATKKLDFHHPLIEHDVGHPERPRSLVGIIVEAYHRRRSAGSGAFTTLSCDNIQHNGAVVHGAVLELAECRDPELASWINAHARFPATMVDRITPVPEAREIDALRFMTGIDDRAAVFSEAFRQWIIEDNFANGRPNWDAVGAQFVTDVAPYERMKLRLLNASHLAISGPAQLMNYVTIHEAMGDPVLPAYMRALMHRETGPTLLPVPGVDLADYKASLVERFANPAICDTVQRVNTDAALNYLLDPLRDRLQDNAPFPMLGFAVAAWLRRVRGEDERGQPILVQHPLAREMQERAREGGADPRPLLEMRALFGTLGDDVRVVETIGCWLGKFYELGAAATMAKAASELGF